MQIVVSRVNDAIKRDLQTVAGDDANLAWRRLEELYGPASSGNNDFSTAFYRCLGIRMDGPSNAIRCVHDPIRYRCELLQVIVGHEARCAFIG